LVKVAKDKKQLIEILKNIDKFNIDKELIDKFLSYLHDEYLIPDSWRNPTEKHFRAIERENSVLKSSKVIMTILVKMR